jgi:hypothetical protein
MGWVEDEFQNRQRDNADRVPSSSELQLESREQRLWAGLVSGLEGDLAEFKNVGGQGLVERINDTECRVSNPKSGIAVLLHADLEAHTIRYNYEPESENTAVPEGGVLTLRASSQSVDMYSADQRLTSQDARRLVLEPLLFPRAPMQGLEPTGT